MEGGPVAGMSRVCRRAQPVTLRAAPCTDRRQLVDGGESVVDTLSGSASVPSV